MLTQMLRILGVAQVLPSTHEQPALSQSTDNEHWAKFGWGALTGATTELLARFPNNTCVREVSEAAGDIYMVAKLLLKNTEENRNELYTSTYFLSLVF